MDTDLHNVFPLLINSMGKSTIFWLEPPCLSYHQNWQELPPDCPIPSTSTKICQDTAVAVFPCGAVVFLQFFIVLVSLVCSERRDLAVLVTHRRQRRRRPTRTRQLVLCRGAAAVVCWLLTWPVMWRPRLLTPAPEAACDRRYHALCDESFWWSRYAPCESCFYTVDDDKRVTVQDLRRYSQRYVYKYHKYQLHTNDKMWSILRNLVILISFFL